MRLFDPDLWAEMAQVAVRNPLRTGLTAMGVFWGALILVLMTGFGTGLERGVMRAMGGSATNAVYVWGQQTALPYNGQQPGRSVDFRMRDLAALAQLPGVALVTPRLQIGGYRGGAIVRHGDKTGSFQLQGDTYLYGQVQNVIFDKGRFINPLDDDGARKVAVIGAEVRKTLFEPHDDPVGQWITVQGIAFQVVGTFHALAASDEADRQESTVHVPLTTYQQVFNAGDRIGWFALLADDGVSAAEVDEMTRATLGRLHGVNPADTQAMGSHNKQIEYSRLSAMFRGIRGMVWVVGIATLASGVIGVSNILLIVVRERTQEIGLRRALGATPRSIVTMIVGEAIVLTTLSGLSGVIAGSAIVEVTAMVIGPDHPSMGLPSVDPFVAVAAALVLIFAGALAGFLPARRALAISPVTALRAE